MYAAQRCAADLQGHSARCAVSHTCSAAHKVYRSAEILSFINKRNEPDKRIGLIENKRKP